MLIDLRYHIITIVIIFVTLAIGILIGGSMVGNELISNEQKNLISRLEEEFHSLRNENKEFSQEVNSLEEKLSLNRDFQRVTMPLVLKEQLNERRVLLVVGEGVETSLLDRLIDTLRLGGAAAVEVSDLNEDFWGEDFDKVLLLGPKVDRDIQSYGEVQSKVIEVDEKDLESISGLIKLVFQVASKELVF